MTKQENIDWMRQYRESGKLLSKEERIERMRMRIQKFNEAIRYVESLGYVPILPGPCAMEHGEHRHFFAFPYQRGVEFYKTAGWINADNTITFLSSEEVTK